MSSYDELITRTTRVYDEANEEASDTPDYESEDYRLQLPAVRIVQDVYAGTLRLRDCGETYLPRFPLEYRDVWESRRQMAVLVPKFAESIAKLSGLLIGRGIALQDDVPEPLQRIWETIDASGTHGDVFIADLLCAALRDGHVFVLVDAPPEYNGNRRPYWSIRLKNEAVNWRTGLRDGQTILTQITFKEVTSEPDEGARFAETIAERYRVFTLTDTGVDWQLWRKIKQPNQKIKWEVEAEGRLRLSSIPVSVLYADRAGFLVSTPPLLDLALLNLLHYQVRSDYLYQLHLASVALLVGVGFEEGQTLDVAAASLTRIHPGQDLKYVEISGNAASALREALSDIERQIDAMSLPSGDPVAKTATEARQAYLSRTASLQTLGIALRDAIETALAHTAAFYGLPSGGSVSITPDLRAEVADQAKLAALQQARNSGDVSRETYLQRLAEWGVLPEGVTPKVEIERIAEDWGGPSEPPIMPETEEEIT